MWDISFGGQRLNGKLNFNKKFFLTLEPLNGFNRAVISSGDHRVI